MTTRSPARAGQSDDRSWTAATDQLVASFRSSERDGLTPESARERLLQGRNVLPSREVPSLPALVVAQLRETMVVVLLLAGVFTTAIGDLADTVIIGLVVVVNTALGVGQQRRAQRAIAALDELSAPTARVVRAGEVRLIDAQEVVPGDVLEVEAGSLVAADGRLLEAQGLQADEATLTGESVPVAKAVGRCQPDALVSDRSNMLHAGTAVTHGRGRLLVTATGAQTQVGRLARLVTGTVEAPTPLQRRLDRLARWIAVGVAVLCTTVVVMGLLRGQDAETMVLTGISLAVAAVPESLPAVVALSLALAAQRMASRHAVVRTLPAVEALGTVTVVAADKTGTLTEGSMVATGFWTPAGSFVPPGPLTGGAVAVTAGRDLLRAVVLCNDATQVAASTETAGDPLEGALLTLAAQAGVAEDLRAQWPRTTELAFDHSRARMTTVHRSVGGDALVVCKGAPEVLLSLVAEGDPVLVDARVELQRLTTQGLRVLAVAQSSPDDVPAQEQVEAGLRLLGLVALHDPPRPSAAAAVQAVKSAGVVPVMITGDHPDTAAAIARELGILEPAGLVATGRQLRTGLTDEDVRKVQVFARVEPEQKLDVVQALRRSGHVVAMTGDGVNDAPALVAADIGVAMGRGGTEVARQASDVVLTDDDLGTLALAITEGRRVFDNIRRFLLYGLSGGGAEVLVMLVGPAVGLPLPLLPGQILWINMLTHGLPGVALGAEQPEPDASTRPPRDPRRGLFGDGLAARILLTALVLAGSSLAVGVVAEQSHASWQSMIFVTLTLSQLGVALALRSDRRSMLKTGWRGNPLLLLSIAANLVLLWLAVVWAPLRDLLDTEALDVPEVLTCLLAASAAPLVLETQKALTRRRSRPGRDVSHPLVGRRVRDDGAATP